MKNVSPEHQATRFDLITLEILSLRGNWFVETCRIVLPYLLQLLQYWPLFQHCQTHFSLWKRSVEIRMGYVYL